MVTGEEIKSLIVMGTTSPLVVMSVKIEALFAASPGTDAFPDKLVKLIDCSCSSSLRGVDGSIETSGFFKASPTKSHSMLLERVAVTNLEHRR